METLLSSLERSNLRYWYDGSSVLGFIGLNIIYVFHISRTCPSSRTNMAATI